MSKWFLPNDEAVVNLDDELKKEECLKSLENDEWSEAYLREVAVLGFDNYPMFIQQETKNITVDMNGYKKDLPDIDLDIPENRECIERGYGIFLSFPGGQNHYHNEPTREICWRDITDRGGMTCPTMLAWEKKETRQPLPVKEKAALLTRVYQLYGTKCKILKRYGKISGMKSAGYVILPPPELVETMEEELKKAYPDITYKGGSFSHEYLQLEYLVNDPLIEDEFLNLLKKVGLRNVTKAKAGIRFSTSDIGSSSVQVRCFFEISVRNEGTMHFLLSSGVKMEHKDDASIDKFRKLLDSVGKCFSDNEERIEVLGNIDVFNIKKVIMRIREKYPAFTKVVTEDVADKYEAYGNSTGIDVYLAFMEIIERMSKAEQMSPTKYLALCDAASKILYLPIDEIDKGNW